LDRLEGVTPLYDVPIAERPFGDATAKYFEQRIEGDGGAESIHSGIIALLIPESMPGGLVVSVTRPEAAPTSTSADELSVVQEELASLYQVLNRLCSPDESGDPAAANLNVACLPAQ
jgi:hypothetical protein